MKWKLCTCSDEGRGGFVWRCWGKWGSEVYVSGCGWDVVEWRRTGLSWRWVLNADTVWRGREEKGPQRENESERLAELLRGDQRVNREKELFGLWRHDMLIIPLHISSIRGCKKEVAWLGAVYYGFVNNLTAEFSAIWICATVWLRRANRALERYVWSWELITRDS